MLWQYAFVGIFVLLSIFLFVRQFRVERREIETFEGDDLQFFKIETLDWKVKRIVKRAQPLGWEVVTIQGLDGKAKTLILKRTNKESAPISNLLKRLHRVGFVGKPLRGTLSDENCSPKDCAPNAQTH